MLYEVGMTLSISQADILKPRHGSLLRHCGKGRCRVPTAAPGPSQGKQDGVFRKMILCYLKDFNLLQKSCTKQLWGGGDKVLQCPYLAN